MLPKLPPEHSPSPVINTKAHHRHKSNPLTGVRAKEECFGLGARDKSGSFKMGDNKDPCQE